MKYTTNCRDYLISWKGNKDREIEYIFEVLTKHNIDIKEYDYIIEPFCGSFSFVRACMRNGINAKYICNDIDKMLIENYNIYKDVDRNKQGIEEIKKLREKITDRETYKKYANLKSPASFMLYHTYYSLHPGLYPTTRTVNMPYEKFEKFVKYKDVEFTNTDGYDMIEKYKDNDKAFLFLDPPYFLSCNDTYTRGLTDDIFKLMENRNKYKCKIMLVINGHVLIKSYIEKLGIPYSEKEITYVGSHKKTTHIYMII